MEILELRSSTREELQDVTTQIQQVAAERGWQNGALLIFCPHTTAAVTVNEGADPDVARDLLAALRRIVPQRGDYEHAEGNSDAHIKVAMTGPGTLVPLASGRIRLGQWQRIFLCEFDGPRRRNLWVQYLPG